jgi:hypothetical protein
MYRHLYAFQTTWERLALFPYLNLLIGGIFLLFLFSKRKAIIRRILLFFMIGGLYLIIRYLLMILLFLYTMYFVIYDEIIRMDIFWNPTFTLLSFIPFLFLLWRFFPLEDEKNANLKEKSVIAFAFPSWNRITLIRVATFVLGVLFLVASFGFHDPGKLKKGRILIDEKHSDWEKTTRPYDTEWYGVDSGYNYASIADYLTYFYKVERIFDEITPELLSNHDILILKIPSHAFSQREIEAILEFVKEGGGLYLIGDHTNVFGSGHYLNQIARHFGFVFRYDCLFDFENTFNEVYTPSPILPHPIVNRMPPFLFAVSCSIEPLSLRNERVILANGLKALDIDYAIENFYPRARNITEMTFGSYIQMIGVKYGKGRVSGFTDSTVFSNFSAFIPGKPELFLGTMDWLNRSNQLQWLNRLFLILSLLAFGSTIILFVSGSQKVSSELGILLLLVILGVSTWSACLYGLTRINHANYPLPEPHTQPLRVCFEKETSEYELPLTEFVENFDQSYAIFYQWVLRLGYFPQVGNTLEGCLEEGNLVILINPQHEFHPQKIEKIKTYLDQGGNILLMESPFNQKSTSNQLLEKFELKIDRGDTLITTPGEIVLYANPILGGEPILTTEDGKGFLSIVREGKGTLAVLTFSDRFVDNQMGSEEIVIPDKNLLRVFQLEFSILRGLINDNIVSEITTWKENSRIN